MIKLKIRFGYVAMSTILEDCSPSKTITIANLNKLPTEEAKIDKLTSLTKTNITNTLRILRHNQAHDIKVFRITSKLVPLASHPITEYWDWWKAIQRELYLGIPMVLDIHHHWCNNASDNIQDYLPAIFATWANESLPPKIHLSSPKGDKNFRSHADKIDLTSFLEFLEGAKTLDQDFDVMIEAKNKDFVLFELMSEIGEIPGIHPCGEAPIQY